MIYTLGHKESYERYFEEQDVPKKKGRDQADGYPGGSVWRTRAEAQRHCPEDFRVYGVLADWETETAATPGIEWNDLLRDAELVRLADGGSPP